MRWKTEGWTMPKVRLAIVALVALPILWQVFVPPIVGLADNGDWNKVAGLFRLQPVTEEGRYFGWVVTKLREDPASPRYFYLPTSAHLLVAPSICLGKLVSKDGILDIRWVGLGHSALFLFAIWLVAPLVPKAMWIPAMLVVCDVAYVSYFNSFYMDAEAFLMLLILMAAYLRLAAGYGAPRLNVALFVSAAILLVTAKTQHSPLGILLALFVLWKRDLLVDKRWRYGVAGCLLLASGAFLIQVPQGYKAMAFYNVVFSGLLPNSSNPTEVLKSLDLPPESLRYSGTHSFQPDSGWSDEHLRPVLLSRSSPTRLGWYYVTHPHDTLKIFFLGLSRAALQRPFRFGNFSRDSGFPVAATSQAFAFWSDFKQEFFRDRPGRYLLLLLVPSLLLVVLLRGPWRDGAYLLTGMAFTELVLGSLGDVKETTRHLFLFNAMLDLVLLCFLARVVLLLSAWRSSRASTRLP